MSTTVKVSARAWGATVTISSEGASAEVVQLDTHEDRTFHIEPGQSLTVDHGKEPKTEELNGEELPPVTPVTRNKPTAPATAKDPE